MHTYDYYRQLKEAVYSEFSEDGYDTELVQSVLKDSDDFAYFYERFLSCDAVTGAGSGSYFCNTFEAMEMILNNYDLLDNCVSDGMTSYEQLGIMICSGDFDGMDVMIRQDLLHFVMSEIADNGGENL